METENLKSLLAIANDQKLRPDLSLIYFYEDRVQATNMLVWLDCENSFSDLSGCVVPASEFVRAFEIIDKASLKISKSSERLVLKDKQYEIKIPIVQQEDFPVLKPLSIDYDKMFSKSPVEAIRKAAQFIDRECSYPFAKSLHFLDGICYVIGHAFLIGFDMRESFLEVFDFEISTAGIDALLRFNKDALCVNKSGKGIYIYLDDGSWFYCRENEAQAPDFREKLKGIDFDSVPEITAELKKSVSDLDQLSMMSADYKHILYFNERGVSTAEGEYHAKASVGKWKESIFAGDLLVSICSVADKIGFDNYPDAVPFCSSDKKIFGIFMGRAA